MQWGKPDLALNAAILLDNNLYTTSFPTNPYFLYGKTPAEFGFSILSTTCVHDMYGDFSCWNGGTTANINYNVITLLSNNANLIPVLSAYLPGYYGKYTSNGSLYIATNAAENGFSDYANIYGGAVGVPVLLPILGAIAALAWSGKIRSCIKKVREVI